MTVALYSSREEWSNQDISQIHQFASSIKRGNNNPTELSVAMGAPLRKTAFVKCRLKC